MIKIIFKKYIKIIFFKTTQKNMLNGKPKIKKNIYYFRSFMLILYTLKGVLNKMSKCLFSSTNIIPTYLSKKLKPIKWGQQ
jgi:hypothetical protein